MGATLLVVAAVRALSTKAGLAWLLGVYIAQSLTEEENSQIKSHRTNVERRWGSWYRGQAHGTTKKRNRAVDLEEGRGGASGRGGTRAAASRGRGRRPTESSLECKWAGRGCTPTSAKHRVCRVGHTLPFCFTTPWVGVAAGLPFGTSESQGSNVPQHRGKKLQS